ncbi:MAG: lysophospholipase, partial [Candidatus Obscuribacterales bacterium]|nr:lysophospholipase [Candidatus Obscuribacterales bacterium]
ASSSDGDKTSDKTADKTPRTGKRAKNPFPDVLPCLTFIDPDKDQKAILVCVHGLGLNSGSYKDFGDTMSKLGYLVYSVDMPGFGSFQKAEGRDRVDFDYCMRGLVDTLRFIHKANPRLPLFILGESMGGAIALRFSAEHPDLVDGLISSVPSGDRFNQSKEALKVGLKLLTAPNKKFDIGTSIIEKATKDCALRTRWADDPLNRMDLSPKELVRFQDFMNDNFEAAKRITATPVLFVQGCKDKLVHPEGTQELYNALNTKDRQIELILDGEHLIFEEGQFKEPVIKTVDAWLAAHIASSKQIGSK